ncbi:hypothetical protein H7100_02315 [Candidatus Saccharibacteria bacterium]|nr:hypothetical protein [Candidatus Saccharibacteria bacterium]
MKTAKNSSTQKNEQLKNLIGFLDILVQIDLMRKPIGAKQQFLTVNKDKDN